MQGQKPWRGREGGEGGGSRCAPCGREREQVEGRDKDACGGRKCRGVFWNFFLESLGVGHSQGRGTHLLHILHVVDAEGAEALEIHAARAIVGRRARRVRPWVRTRLRRPRMRPGRARGHLDAVSVSTELALVGRGECHEHNESEQQPSDPSLHSWLKMVQPRMEAGEEKSATLT